MTNDQDMQQQYMQLQALDEQIKLLQKQLQTYEEQLGELMAVKNAIDEFAKTKPGAELLIPISPGIFVKGSLIDNKNLQVNVGGSAVVQKTLAEGKGLLDKQAKDIEQARMAVISETERIIEQAKGIEQKILKQSK